MERGSRTKQDGKVVYEASQSEFSDALSDIGLAPMIKWVNAFLMVMSDNSRVIIGTCSGEPI
jgi:hypothetical protein